MTNDSKTQWLKIIHVYHHHTVSVGRESGIDSAGWFWLQVSWKVVSRCRQEPRLLEGSLSPEDQSKQYKAQWEGHSQLCEITQRLS